MSAATGKPVPPMLATLGQPPTGERWAFESKWDGVRAIATTGTKPPALWSRNGNNFSASFPEIVDALSAVLDHRETVLDGEIVALGPDGVPSFSRLQRRMHVLKPTAQLRNDDLTTYYVFDVEYREYTGGGLRHPAFKGMRIDKTAIDVDLPGHH
ncbi:hypothetical protein LRQ08_31260 (plasmid) [Rhodococcus qingshengii]|uniref:ATP-dependent DNA ligase n=1 Tax=Rhodococcus qingshengii TaxID=334542 RepID=UPI0021117176|nr:hypothetical protein [Rhodococcus qingshengii]UUE28419.1 hypothetical protein LRQ08_31260 [Rhodococcus qingshengii]